MDKFVVRLQKNAPEPEINSSTSTANSPGPENQLNDSIATDTEKIGNDIVEVESTHDGTDNGSDDTGSKENARPRKRRKYGLKSQTVKTLTTNYPWLDNNTSYLRCKLCDSKISGGKYHLKRHDEKPHKLF
ncbi:hypothetical protein JTB14_032889 [Gonioctena quinquepunctata]|nr:hypothetical protein JTB14_032889 [Gonioctena quinquepunctata]